MQVGGPFPPASYPGLRRWRRVGDFDKDYLDPGDELRAYPVWGPGPSLMDRNFQVGGQTGLLIVDGSGGFVLISTGLRNEPEFDLENRLPVLLK